MNYDHVKNELVIFSPNARRAMQTWEQVQRQCPKLWIKACRYAGRFTLLSDYTGELTRYIFISENRRTEYKIRGYHENICSEYEFLTKILPKEVSEDERRQL